VAMVVLRGLPVVGMVLSNLDAIGIVNVGVSEAVDLLLRRPSLRLATSGSLFKEVLAGGNVERATFLPVKFLSFDKLDRQGSFDSCHMAPRMRADKLLADPKLKNPRYSLDSIAMAPFCEHDCLHTHWRWGAGWSDARMKPVRKNVQSLSGFSGGGVGKFKGVGKPYAGIIGAPMVPINQDVRLRLPWKTTLTYAVNAFEPEPGVWQIVNHHGSGYALAITDPAMVGHVRDVIAGSDEGAELYWNMRYQGANDGKLERLDIRDLNACRDEINTLIE
jgi:hypothetical protein